MNDNPPRLHRGFRIIIKDWYVQDLETLEGKTIVELREIAKSLGITPSTMKKQELFEKIVEFATGAAAQSNSATEVEVEVEQQPAPRRGRRPRMASVKVSEAPRRRDNTENNEVVNVADVAEAAEVVEQPMQVRRASRGGGTKACQASWSQA